jgi:HEAT repeat protein
LESGKKEVRDAAAEALGKIGDPRAIEPLSKALRYNYYGDLSIVAIKALGNIPDSSIIEPICEALKNNDKYIRCVAAEILGKIGDVRSLKPLQDALKDKDTLVRYAAAKAIKKSTLSPDITTTIGYLIAQNKWEDCVTVGNDAVEPLCEVLMTMSKKGRGFTPAWVPQGAVSPVNEKWYWEDIRHRQEIIKALVKIGDPNACATLVWISDNDPYSINLLEYEEIPARNLIWPIRVAAAEAIKQINHTNTEMK